MNKDMHQRGGMYLGAVGAYDWSGTVVKYDSSDDVMPDISTFEEVRDVLAARTEKYSYLGYAITSGFYNTAGMEYVAVGAPRNQLYGAVVVYRPQTGSGRFRDAVTIYPSGNETRQLGSYFGGVLLSTDVNNDGLDDLFVAAPLYIIGSSYDNGRVFAYISRSSGRASTDEWANRGYMPTILSAGNNEAGGRFGSAMAAAGDLNGDRFNDIIVGAPFLDDNKGAVFVFHGSDFGIDPDFKQVIRASTINSVNLQYFGLALAGGQDLDGNQYPDIAVGAPRSDAVVIFRSRPVAEIRGTLGFSNERIEIFQCFSNGNRNCVDLTMCLQVGGRNIEPNITVRYDIVLDSGISGRDNKRIEFRESETSAGTDVLTGLVTVTRNASRQCLTFPVSIKRTISDYSSPITATLTYEIADDPSRQALSSVRDPSINNTVSATTFFVRGCGEEDVCRFDLVVSGSIELPEYLNGDGVDLSKRGILVVSRQTESDPIQVRVEFANQGENAFDVRVAIYFNEGLTFQSLGNFQSSNTASPDFPCVVLDSQQDPNVRPYMLRYQHSPQLGSIMRRGENCSFEFNLTSSALRRSSTVPEMNVTVFVHTSNGIENDQNPGLNTFNDTATIRYRADASLTSQQIETIVPFNFTDANQTIFSVFEIGQNTSDIPLQYQVSGTGYSNIPFSSFNLTFPYDFPTEYIGSYHILYPYSYSCTTNTGDARCECNNDVINPYNLTTFGPRPEVTRGLDRVMVAPHPTRINESITFNCSDPDIVSSGICQTFSCNVTNLGPSETVTLRVVFRLWTQSFNLVNGTSASFVSHFSYSTEGSNLLINSAGDAVTTLSTSTITQGRLFVPGAFISPENNIWIYIVAAIGGLLLLIIIIIILWKTGFFKSKYAEKKEALAWTEANAE